MNNLIACLKSSSFKYALRGILFGFLFPILATVIIIVNEGLPFNFAGIFAAQKSSSLLWIIDSAPLFLGLFAWLIGCREKKVLKLNSELMDANLQLGNKISDLQKLEIELRLKEDELLDANRELKDKNIKLLESKRELQNSNQELLASENQLSAFNQDLVKANLELLETKEELEKSESRYRELIEGTSDIPYVINVHGIITYIGPQIEEFGWTHDEIVGKEFPVIIHQDDRVMMQEVFNQSLESGNEIPATFKIMSKTGDIAWLESRVKVGRNENGEVSSVSGVLRNITERKIAEDALKENEEKYRNLVERSNDGITLIVDSTVKYVNPRLAQMLGYEPSEMINRPFAKFIHPDDTGLLIEQYNQRLDGEYIPNIYEARLINKDGHPIHVEINAGLVQNEGQMADLVYVRDITQRIEAERSIRESEAKFRSIVQSSPMGMHFYELDDDSKLIFSGGNPAANKILGIDCEELIGKTIEEAFPALADTDVPSRYIRVAQSGVPWNVEQIMYDDGVIAGVFQVHAFQINPGAVAVMFQDITERKLADQAVKESEEKYRNVVERANDLIVIIKDSLIQYVNRIAADTVGYSVDEMIRTPFIKYIHPSERQKIMDIHERIINGDDKSFFESTLITKDGDEIEAEFSIGVIQYEGARAGMAIIRNISDRKQAERQQKSLQEKLDKAERMESLGVLAGGVAHDLNNMLGPLVAYPEMILMKLEKESPVRKQIIRMGRAASDAADIIQDLLTLARRGRYEMVGLDFNEVIESYLDSPSFVKLTEQNPEVTVNVKLKNDLGNINGSSPHLTKLLMNLIVNAFDAMPEGGTLEIRTDKKYVNNLITGSKVFEKGDYVVVSVKDTGIGISQEDLNRIFEPYYSKKKMGASGSGLGMSVVYGILKDHKAYYDIDSTVGKGTEFIIYFPAYEVPEDKTEDIEINIKGTEHILVVDDMAEQREIASEILSGLGYRVGCAVNGRDAVNYVKRNRVDILVLDMIMEPDYDGLDTYRDILKIQPDQKCVVVSGFASTERVSEMQTLGAGAYIRKPYTLHSLGQAIRKELDRKEPSVST